MTDSSLRPEPRSNPFWAYRDPHSGRWITLMTATQCCQLAKQVFAPRRHQPSVMEDTDGFPSPDSQPLD